MECDQLVIKQQSRNICDLQGSLTPLALTNAPFPSPKSFPAAELRARVGEQLRARQEPGTHPSP